MPVASATLSCWKEIHSFAKPGWVYRGHKVTDWPIRTSLERCCERENIKPHYHRHIEDALIRDFQRAYHHYGLHVPADKSIIEWIALMQHHGAPTRVVDFTYSIYVAAYFALESADSNCAVWAVRAPWALTQSVAAFRGIGKPKASLLQSPTGKRHEVVANGLLFSKPFAKVAIPLSPFRLNERLRTQRATFLVPGDVSHTFEHNLFALAGHNRCTNLVKIEFP